MSDSASTPAIRVDGLVRHFGETRAVDGLSFEVPVGTCQGFLGPNGAGKTTTINMLVGLDRPQSGTVEVLGHTWKASASTILHKIGVHLQETRLPEKLTTTEILRLFASFYENALTVEEVLETTALEEKRSARVRELSGGQQQRLALGCALIGNPEILFLDEPTTGLDPQARRRVWDVIEEFRSRGGTVLLTTHYMDEAEQLSDHVIIVDHGRSIAEGTPAEIIERLAPRTRVRCDVASAPTEVLVEALRDKSEVHEVRVSGLTIDMQVGRVEIAVPALLEEIRILGVTLDDLRTHRPTLEDVFVTLTGRQLRE